MEDRMASVETRLTEIESKLDIIMNDMSVIISLNESVSTITGFVRKHYSKAVSFGAGIMTIAGIGNPHLWDFIANFKW